VLDLINWLSQFNYRTIKTGIIESCTMSFRISHFRKWAKNTAKEERLSPSERHKKQKNMKPYQRGATLTAGAQHTTRLFQFLR